MTTSGSVEANFEDPDPWSNHVPPDNLGGPDFGRLLQAFRLLQDRFSASCPPDGEVARLANEVAALADRFSPWEAQERHTAAEPATISPAGATHCCCR